MNDLEFALKNEHDGEVYWGGAGTQGQNQTADRARGDTGEPYSRSGRIHQRANQGVPRKDHPDGVRAQSVGKSEYNAERTGYGQSCESRARRRCVCAKSRCQRKGGSGLTSPFPLPKGRTYTPLRVRALCEAVTPVGAKYDGGKRFS